jgi:NAD(P)-dependent dehydrogenase (short-subunit alcohol dehydrogenase family)
MTYRALSLEGRVAVVIGGTTGIGRTISLAFAEAGADVVASARGAANLESVATEIEARGKRTLRVASDVANRGSIEALRDAVVAGLGGVDILVNCAGRTQRTPTLDVSEAEWNGILDINLTGTLRTCQIFGRTMIERGYGRIINIASVASFVALFEVAAYGASKAAVAALTRQLAIEWGPKGVCVNAIAPGVFRTALNRELLDGTARGQEFLLRNPMRRFGQLDELAGAAVFLASESASFVNGEVLVVDGGYLASGVNH